MSNVLNDGKHHQIVALGRLGWSLRRIEQATGVRRETVSGYLKAVGIVVQGRGRRRESKSKPAISPEVSTDSGASNPAISGTVSTDADATKPATRVEVSDSILLVEDEHALRVTLGDRLRKEGYLVDCAGDAEEAVDKATRLAYDLFILDVMLPGRDGLVLCRDIRAAGLIAPVLMLTARGRTAEKVSGFKTGADDYVTKPFKMPELLARVEALLRRAPVRPAPHPAIYRTLG